MKNIFSSIKKGIGDINTQILSINQAIKNKEQRCHDLKVLPLPKSDFADMYCENIDLEADKFGENFAISISRAKETYVEVKELPPVLQTIGNYYTNDIKPINIYAIFRDQIKDSVRKLIMDQDWPGVVGPPRHERKSELDRLENEISELKNELDQLITEADQLGLKKINLS